MRKSILPLVILGLSFVSTPGCMSAYVKSVGGTTSHVFDRNYSADFEIAWQSVLEALKNSRMDITNKEGGYIQTKWIENTTEKNFIDVFGDTGVFIKAQHRLKISLVSKATQGKPTVRVRVVKEQLIQRDILDGWRPMETDGIDENTLLYRIGRVIAIKTKVAQMEETKTQLEIRKNSR